MTLEVIASDVLAPFRHGFFTRKGGASSGIFEGLNCGRGSSDQADVVEINRARAAHAMGAEPGFLVGVHQVHSARAVVVETPQTGAQPEADAVVTRTPGLVLSVLTADCAPVLMADTTAGVIGAAHAGWRGALDGVLEATLEAMEGLGAQRSAIRAVVGPTISQRAYEVGPEFLDRFLDADIGHGRFFVDGRGDRYHFDLPAFALFRLREAGVGHAEWSRHCTYSDPDRFFSFRRSVHEKQADYGRLIATIRL
jgi:YfiH family protein